jgi:hypothetical protein
VARVKFNVNRTKFTLVEVTQKELYTLTTDEKPIGHKPLANEEIEHKSDYQLGFFSVYYRYDKNGTKIPEVMIATFSDEVENDQTELEVLIDQARDQLGIALEDLELLISSRHTQQRSKLRLLKARETGNNNSTFI